MTEPLVPELVECQAQFRFSRAAARALCAGLTARQFNWQPAPGRWSVAQCRVHLNISARLLGESIGTAAARARAAGVIGSGPFRYGLLSRWLIRAVEPENRRRYTTPRTFAPAPTVDDDVGQVLEVFLAAGASCETCLQETNRLDLARVKVPSPAVPFLRFQLGALIAVQAAHERRHLAQARELTATPGFPRD